MQEEERQLKMSDSSRNRVKGRKERSEDRKEAKKDGRRCAEYDREDE